MGSWQRNWKVYPKAYSNNFMRKISIHQEPYCRNTSKNRIITALPIRNQNASKNPGNSTKHTKWFVMESFIHSFLHLCTHLG